MTLTQINKAGLDEIALDHVFTIGASGTDHYTFQGEGLNGTVNDPTLYLTRGKTYRFENGTGAHAIRIQSADDGTSGTLYNTGVTNNNSTGTVIVEVQHDAPDVLYYQCASHANMKGTIYVTGALADGNVTTAKIAANAVTSGKIASNAVTTSELSDNAVISSKIADSAVSASKLGSSVVSTTKIQDNAVTADKIASGVVGATELGTGAVTEVKIASGAVTQTKIGADAVNSGQIADGAVITAAIADQAVDLTKLPHGTSSNNGKFLRANNGADPSFESVPSPAITAINNATNNRVVTSEGGTTVNAESGLTYNGSTLGLSGSLAMTGGGLSFEGHPLVGTANFTCISGGSYAARLGSTGSSTIRSTQIYGGGGHIATFDGVNVRLGIGETAPDGDLHIKSSNPAIYLEDSTNSSQHGQAIIEQNGDNLKIRQDAGNASSGSGSNISFQVDAAERVKVANLGDSEYGLKFLNSKAIEFKDSNMEICTLTWSINANTWTNFFSGSQNHMSWLFINGIHNSGNSSALWALSDSWSGGSSYATRKIHQNNYGPADIDIQRNGV